MVPSILTCSVRLRVYQDLDEHEHGAPPDAADDDEFWHPLTTSSPATTASLTTATPVATSTLTPFATAPLASAVAAAAVATDEDGEEASGQPQLSAAKGRRPVAVGWALKYLGKRSTAWLEPAAVDPEGEEVILTNSRLLTQEAQIAPPLPEARDVSDPPPRARHPARAC